MWVMVEGSTSHTQIWAKRNICTYAGACMQFMHSAQLHRSKQGTGKFESTTITQINSIIADISI